MSIFKKDHQHLFKYMRGRTDGMLASVCSCVKNGKTCTCKCTCLVLPVKSCQPTHQCADFLAFQEKFIVAWFAQPSCPIQYVIEISHESEYYEIFHRVVGCEPTETVEAVRNKIMFNYPGLFGVNSDSIRKMQSKLNLVEVPVKNYYDKNAPKQLEVVDLCKVLSDLESSRCVKSVRTFIDE